MSLVSQVWNVNVGGGFDLFTAYLSKAGDTLAFIDIVIAIKD